MTEIDHGHIALTLCGEEFTLTPTLEAMTAIDRQFGSLREAAFQVQQVSLAAIIHIINAGAALDRKERERIPDLVFRHGVLKVVPVIGDYIAALMNPTGEESTGEGKG